MLNRLRRHSKLLASVRLFDSTAQASTSSLKAELQPGHLTETCGVPPCLALRPGQASGLDRRSFHASAAASQEFLSLSNISDKPEAKKQSKRVGRGIGSGKGKTSGRGHKGQKARTGRQVKPDFEGGQNPLKNYTPKRGFHNPFSFDYVPLNLYKLQEAVQAKKLNADQLITMRDLRESGVIHRKFRDGVKLLGRGFDGFNEKVEIQVSQASGKARTAIENAGGSVTTVYYNKLGLRALMMPEWFERKGRKLPRPAKPKPKKRDYWDQVGSLPPISYLQSSPSPLSGPPSPLAHSRQQTEVQLDAS